MGTPTRNNFNHTALPHLTRDVGVGMSLVKSAAICTKSPRSPLCHSMEACASMAHTYGPELGFEGLGFARRRSRGALTTYCFVELEELQSGGLTLGAFYG